MATGFSIAEKYVPKEELKKVAKAVLLAQDIHEDSWDDNTKKYKLTDDVASCRAVEYLKLDNFWKFIISNWTYDHWNEGQDWANEILLKGE